MCWLLFEFKESEVNRDILRICEYHTEVRSICTKIWYFRNKSDRE